MPTLTSRTGSTPRRTGLLILVAGLHVLIVYGLMVATGVVRQPAFVQPLEAVFIPEATQSEPEPEIKIKPEIEQPVAVDEPVPEVQFEEAVTPPSDVPVPASANAISGSQQQGAPAQDLKTANRVDPTYPPASRRAGEQGTVRLKVLVDTSGRASNVAVTQTQRLPAAGSGSHGSGPQVALRRGHRRHQQDPGVHAGRRDVQTHRGRAEGCREVLAAPPDNRQRSCL